MCNDCYAEKFVGKASNAYKLPDSVTDIAVGLIDLLMVAYHAINQCGLKLHDKVLVVGSGIIGNLIVSLAKRVGASFVAMSEISDIETAKEKEIGNFDAYYNGNDMESPNLISFPMNRAVLQEMQLIGSVSCTRKEFEETIDLIAGGMIDPEKQVTDVLPLEQLQQVFERLTTVNDPVLIKAV